jgi:hypothetical protein
MGALSLRNGIDQTVAGRAALRALISLAMRASSSIEVPR